MTSKPGFEFHSMTMSTQCVKCPEQATFLVMPIRFVSETFSVCEHHFLEFSRFALERQKHPGATCYAEGPDRAPCTEKPQTHMTNAVDPRLSMSFCTKHYWTWVAASLERRGMPTMADSIRFEASAGRLQRAPEATP